MARSNMIEAGQQDAADEITGDPIDMAHLEAQSLGDPGLQDEVLRLYAQMSGVYLSRIEGSQTPQELMQHLHTLKSAAAGIGAWHVRDLAKHSEDALREGQPINPDHIRAVASAVLECQDFITGLIAAA